ncbi:hypothetical protein TSUKUMMB_55280 [Rhodococcus sp. no. 34]
MLPLVTVDHLTGKHRLEAANDTPGCAADEFLRSPEGETLGTLLLRATLSQARDKCPRMFGNLARM